MIVGWVFLRIPLGEPGHVCVVATRIWNLVSLAYTGPSVGKHFTVYTTFTSHMDGNRGPDSYITLGGDV